MGVDAKWVVGTIVAVAVALAGLIVTGHNGINQRVSGLDDRLRAVEIRLGPANVSAGYSAVVGGADVLSERVVGTVFYRDVNVSDQTSGNGTIELLVLWRGQPQWWSDDRSGMRSRDGTKGVRLQQGPSGVMAAVYDAGVAQVADEMIRLDMINVVLVDDVDGDPAVVGTEWIEPEVGSEKLRALVGRYPALEAFLDGM